MLKKNKVIGIYDYTVVLTYLGMIAAFIGIMLVLNGAYADAVFCLMVAGVCDMFDGTIASTKQRNFCEKHFGIEIDSLCDLISFGVLPALLIYALTGKNPVIGILACIYTLCGLIRLAYFNVQEYERQKITEDKRDVYLGVPITTAAIVFPLGYLMYSKYEIIGVWIFPILAILLGTGFVAGIEIKKPNIVGKIAMIIIGILEMAGVFILTGADIL